MAPHSNRSEGVKQEESKSHIGDPAEVVRPWRPGGFPCGGSERGALQEWASGDWVAFFRRWRASTRQLFNTLGHSLWGPAQVAR